MHITPLEWDTEFFGYRVGRADLQHNETPDRELLLQNDYRLIYVMSEQELTEAQTSTLPVILADRKVLLGKPAAAAPAEMSEHIRPLNILTPALLNLVLQSGHYSRFRIDEKFTNREYGRLYEAWINKALADQKGVVYGYHVNGILAGFITLGIKNEAADIGLIAVDEQFRNRQIGQKLLDASGHFAQQKILAALPLLHRSRTPEPCVFTNATAFRCCKKHTSITYGSKA